MIQNYNFLLFYATNSTNGFLIFRLYGGFKARIQKMIQFFIAYDQNAPEDALR